MKISLHLVNFHHRRTGNSRLQAGEIHLIKQERDKFILKEANKKSNYQINELSYKNYKNDEINISEIKSKKNIISI